MSKRVTIMISDDLDRKVRDKQAALIKKSSASVSYSSVINQVLANKIRL